MGKESDNSVIFDATRLRRMSAEFDARGIKNEAFFADGSDAYANNGMIQGFHNFF